MTGVVGTDIKPKIVRDSRKKLAAIADLCMLPNEPRLERFIEDVGDHGNAIFVYNFPRRQEWRRVLRTIAARPPRRPDRQGAASSARAARGW